MTNQIQVQPEYKQDNSAIYSRHLPTIRQLQYFIAVCEEGNFRKAASRLGVSQPPLSMQIKELEEKLQTTLFVRNTRYVMLTEQGRLFRDQAKSWMENLSQIVNQVSQQPTDKITFGITKVLGFNFIPLFNKFIQQFSSQINLLPQDYSSKELLAEFNKKNIDLAVVTEYKNNSNLANSLLVYREPLVLALPEHHPACTQERVDLNTVVDLPLYWCNRYQNPELYDKLLRVINQLSGTITLQQKLPNFLTMLMEIAMGRGMLLLPASMAQAHIQGAVYKKLTFEYEQQLSMDTHLLWHQSVAVNPVIGAMTDYFKQAINLHAAA